MADTIQDPEQQARYRDSFDAGAFLHSRYNPDTVEGYRKEFPLQQLHDVFATHADLRDRTDLKIVEYGSGPSLLYTISAATRASEIVFAEYTEGSRIAIRQWLDRDPKAFDWSSYFDYVVQTVERGTEAGAREREERLRKAVKGVVHCDIFQECPIERGYEGPYDVVITFLCLENTSQSPEDFLDGVRKLYGLLKPGGVIVMHCVEREPSADGALFSWRCGNEVFHSLPTTGQFVQDTFEQTGFRDFTIKRFKVVKPNDNTLLGTMFITAKKPN